MNKFFCWDRLYVYRYLQYVLQHYLYVYSSRRRTNVCPRTTSIVYHLSLFLFLSPLPFFINLVLLLLFFI